MNFAIIVYNAKASFPYHYVASTTPTSGLPTLADGVSELEDFFTLAEEAGTNKSPVCLIGTADDLSRFATLVNTGGDYLKLNATLTAEITLPTGTNNWTPIGNSSTKYTGTFDGAGYTVSGIDIDHGSSNYQGFFGTIGNGGMVKSLTVTGKVTGNSYVGGIVGRNNYGTLVACYSQVAVKGGYYTGGIAGHNSSGTLTACYSTGTVTGKNNIGGITGYNDLATLVACYSTGTVTGTDSDIGGIVGNNYYALLNACFYQWGTGVPTVGVGYGSGSGQAANASNKSIYFCPVGSAETTGYESITWLGVMGTYGSADEKVKNGSGTATQIPTLNAAITKWNTQNASTPDKQCPYQFVKNTKLGAVLEGVGSEPLVLEEIK